MPSDKFDLNQTFVLLSRTPETLRALLGGLSDSLIRSNEGPDTFSPFDVLEHLIEGEENAWGTRPPITLEHGPAGKFEPFDRFRHRERNVGKTLTQLLDEFAQLRAKN